MNIDGDSMLGVTLNVMYYGCPTLTQHVYGKPCMSLWSLLDAYMCVLNKWLRSLAKQADNGLGQLD